MKKILVAMSGGVDSAGACLLLKRQGYEVCGATMLLRDGGEGEVEDARRAAQKIGVPFYCFDLRKEFRENVIVPFTKTYQAGGTPNPCVVCNRTMKFGLFLEKARELGCDAIATGHYARITEQNGRFLLSAADDRAKDQTYMLCMLNQFQLAHAVFPLAEIQDKNEIRRMLEREGIALAHKHDSQDICFVPDGDYMGYLTAHGLTPQKGNYITPEGKIIAPHKGMEAYTTGQRRGLGIAFGERAYVLGKRGADVIIGAENQLYSTEVFVSNVNYIPFDKPDGPIRVQAKLRYTTRFSDATLIPGKSGCRLLFDEPQRAVTSGQTAAFYDGNTVIGGGIICTKETYDKENENEKV